MPSNVFTILINMLNQVSVRGEEDARRMSGIFQILHEMERAANKPKEEETEDG